MGSSKKQILLMPVLGWVCELRTFYLFYRFNKDALCCMFARFSRLEVATAVVLSRGVGRTSLRTHVDMFHIFVKWPESRVKALSNGLLLGGTLHLLDYPFSLEWMLFTGIPLAWPQALSSRKATATGQNFSLHNPPFWLKLTDSPIREVDTF